MNGAAVGSTAIRPVAVRGLGLAMLAALVAALLWLSTGLGLLDDDLWYPLQVAGGSGWDVLTLELGPLPFQATLWRLAPAVLPEAPYQLAHLVAALAHAANTALVFRLLTRLVGAGGWAWTGAALFAVFRPGNEAVLRAAALSEVTLTTFALLALLAWRARDASPACTTWAVLASAAAMLAKPSALCLPAVLLAHVWLLETPRAARLRRAAAPVAIATVVTALLAANALLRLGTWEYGELSATAAPLEAVGRVGLSLFRVFALVYPPEIAPPMFAGFAALALAAVAFAALRDPVVRFGLLWSVAFLPGSLMVEAQNHPRYEYPAAVGVVLVLTRAGSWLAQRGARPRRLAHAGLAVWAAANLALYSVDVRQLSALGHANSELRTLLRAHRAEITAAGAVVMGGQPLQHRLHADKVFRYDTGLDLAVRHAETCPLAAELPCVEWRLALAPRVRCETPCLHWRPAGAHPTPGS